MKKMRKVQRMTALLLSLIIILSSQGITVLAGGLSLEGIETVETAAETAREMPSDIVGETEEGRIEETLPLEPIASEPEHISETLPLEPLEGQASLEGITAIYWNPGGSLPAELLATASDATANETATATPSNVAAGSDRVDGYSPKHPVKTLETALKQADKLAEEQGADRSDLVIYAMNPMEVPDGRMYVLNAGNIRIASWPDRTYHNDAIFYVNGGQLTLMNAILEAGDEAVDAEEAELVRVSGGALQLGYNVQIDGRIVMDYRQTKGQTEWEKASASNATASNATASNWTESGETGAGFDIDNYILSTDENEWELLEDKSHASTWREPIIELIDGFNGADESFLLELSSDDSKDNVTLAKTLYADNTAPEEFARYFRMADTVADEWNLMPLGEQKAIVYDTGAEDMRRYLCSENAFSLDAEAGDETSDEDILSADGAEGQNETAVMTIKTLMASRTASDKIVYWNPGGDIPGTIGKAGSDSVSGSSPLYPFKTLAYAIQNANGGTIIAMQTLDLGDPDVGQYLPAKEGDAWLVKATSSTVIPSIRVWEVKPEPIFRVPAGQELILEDIMIEGIAKDGKYTDTQAIVVDGGDLTVRANVTADTGYIQVNATDKATLAAHPVHADSTTGVSVKLFFSGINNSLDCNYVDVVVPTENLTPASAPSDEKVAIGQELLDCYHLTDYHHTIDKGGTSKFEWSLRPDEVSDDLYNNPQNLELYAEYYYDAVYVDGERGDDRSLGSTCQSPVKTFAKAKEIWEKELNKSLDAREAAWNSNSMSKSDIEATYPYPSRIYVCGPLQVSSSETWELMASRTDFDLAPVSVEIQSHWDNIPEKADGSPVHGTPETMIEVPAGVSLRLQNIVIRNDSHAVDSQTVLVNGTGAVLELGKNTILKGNRDAVGTIGAWAFTNGIHIKAVDGATVKLPDEGRIFVETRGQGIVADGTGTTVEMAGGSIRNNTSTTKNGGGVALTGGAVMNMTGGVISGNRTNLEGGGVHLTGAGTTFNMTGGSIENNGVYAALTSIGSGMGIYAGSGTVCNIGTDSGQPQDVTIKENKGYRTYGSGICSYGTLNIKKAQISDNTADVSIGGTNNNVSVARGIGIYVGNTGTMRMEGTEVTGNRVQRPGKNGYETGYGAGIYIGSAQAGNTITDSTISGNIIGYGSGSYASDSSSRMALYSRGGGIAYEPTGNSRDCSLKISKTTIRGNRALTGAGIQVYSYLNSYPCAVEVTDCTIRDNTCSLSLTSESDPSVYGYGGGINTMSYGNKDTNFTVTDSTIEGNKAAEGGGICVLGRGKLSLFGTSSDSFKIQNNQGGGIYAQYSSGYTTYSPTILGSNVLIQDNTGLGGIYSMYGSIILQESRIIGNEANGYGGGLSLNYGTTTLGDVKIEENRSKFGGGISINSSAKLYWSETMTGGSSLKGNIAVEKGGGLYVTGNGTSSGCILDFAGEIQNSAGEQGSNIYAAGGGANIIQSTLKQPESPLEGVYNVYLDGGTSVTYALGMDPTRVMIEKKAGANPDAVYLNTGTSTIRYYQTPSSATVGSLPIDLNPDVFKIGSVVIKPANIPSLGSQKPNFDKANGYDNYTIPYPEALKDASVRLSYEEGGKLPRRTQLGGFKDPSDNTLTNVVLVGEGVYLSGAGNDSNDGSSPQQAVATFGRAKALLGERITARKSDAKSEEGYAPYIYICGNVSVTDGEVWKLDYEDPLFLTENANYITWEKTQDPTLTDDSDELKAQVRRFASFLTSPMITVESGKKFQMDRIIVNGMMQAVDTTTQSDKSPLINTAGTVTLTGDAQLQNNWKRGVVVQQTGRLILDGTEKQKNEQLKDITDEAVSLEGAHPDGEISLEMRGYSKILRETQKVDYGIYVRNSDKTIPTRITMRGHSVIGGTAEQPMTWGIYTIPSEGCTVEISMEDHAKIDFTSVAIRAESRGKTKILMNCNSDAKAEDSAKITNGGSEGIFVSGSSCEIYMKKHAEIVDCGKGIFFDQQQYLGTAEVGMSDDSVIRRCDTAGILFENAGPATILMEDNARIVRNGYGIKNGYYANRDKIAENLFITMKGNARISANSHLGVMLGKDNTYFYNASVPASQKLILMDYAMIGGDKAYTENVSDENCGNKGEGIELWVAASVELQGNSKVCYNQTGIEWNRSFYWKDLWATLTMQDESEISYNEGKGIHTTSDNKSTNPVKVTIKGNAQVRENNTGHYNCAAVGGINPNMELYLEDNAKVLGSEADFPIAMEIYGKLYLDGTVEVSPEIALWSYAISPIILTAQPTAGREYHLRLIEAYMGKQVVVPDGITVMDATPYLANFIKAYGQDLAGAKNLVAFKPDIILEGENNVYLSGSGNDVNDGNSPSTAVRTFHRARELLRTGRFTKGANILICNSEVAQTNWSDATGSGADDDWSFDPGGTVTNAVTNETWKPLVIRADDYSGIMIRLKNNQKIVLKDITLDGNKDVLSIRSMIMAEDTSVVTLGSGAVIQNGKNTITGSYNTYTPGILMNGGTLNIEGAVIQGMERQWQNRNTETPAASAVYVSSSATANFKSGQIRDNRLSDPGGYYSTGGAVVVLGRFNMTGGSISGNVNESSKMGGYPTSSYGSALYVYKGRAEIKGGSIRGNTGGVGRAVYYQDDFMLSNYPGNKPDRGVILSGGLIEGNPASDKLSDTEAGIYSPIYVNGGNFQLEGSYCDLKESIYLADNRCPIYVSGDMYRTGRQYRVYLNQGGGSSQYHKGSVVVAPDGDKKQDVSGYLSYFQVASAPYVLDRGQIERTIATGGIMESQCLLLMKAIFIDGENGADNRTGLSPQQAVKTFSKAKTLGEVSDSGQQDYYIVYVCGTVTNTAAETAWNMATPAYMCRYTGFTVYDTYGAPVKEENRPYRGFLITPSHDLTFERLAVYGRRPMDDLDQNGNSLVRIPAGVTVTVQTGASGEAVFGRNYNAGNYIGDDNLSATTDSKGGAFKVEPEGRLILESGRIVETEAPYGSAIYLGADEADAAKTGHLIMDGAPEVNGTVYMAGTGAVTAAYVEPRETYAPTKKLQLAIGNDYNGRTCVVYPAGTTPGQTELECFSFEDSIYALYDVEYDETQINVIELKQKLAIYLDGVDGDDRNDGQTPEKAFKTVYRCYEYINHQQSLGRSAAEGSVIYVVGTVTFDGSNVDDNLVMYNVQLREESTGKKYYKGYYESDMSPQLEVTGQVYFKRYVQPKDYKADDADFTGYGKDSLLDELFYVKNGQRVTLWGMYLDGHSQSSVSSKKLYNTDGVEAMAPLVTVEDAVLNCQYETTVANNIPTSTLFLNNKNINKKDTPVGTIGSSTIYEGSSAGIELKPGGTCNLTHAEFRNLELGGNVLTGGTDIYHNGAALMFEQGTKLSGTVFLEGQGTASNELSKATSRYLTVGTYGDPMAIDIQILMRDPYQGRKVVQYPHDSSVPEGIYRNEAEIAMYRLEERVKEFFYLYINSTDNTVLELTVPASVYVDGQNGVDDWNDPKAGSAPQYPVRTLKKAYELLNTRGGDTIIVVGTVEIEADCVLTGVNYSGTDGEVNLNKTDRVHLLRYIQPDFARLWSIEGKDPDKLDEMGYNRDDFADGPLIHVQPGKRLTLGSMVDVDGHSKEKDYPDCPDEVKVSRQSVSYAPLIDVADGGTLRLAQGASLHDNDNWYGKAPGRAGMDGGAIHNLGSVTVDGAVFTDNHAAKGDAAYQAGQFTIQNGVENLKDHSFYLASENSGTEAAPVWGEDYVLQIAEKVPDGQIFDIDMDHAVAGRDVIRFIANAAYAPASGADAEHEHFGLGTTVPDELFLVEAEDDPAVLELQDWKILHAEVPADIYLAVTRKGTIEGSTALQAVREGTAELFSSPQYQIHNKGRYDMRVSVTGIDNQNDSAGIPSEVEKMTLKDSKAAVIGNTDLYLGIKGIDDEPTDGLTAAEIPLTEGSFIEKELGQLKAGSTGGFELTGAVGYGFVDKYKDLSYPLTDTTEDVQKYMDGTGPDGLVRAKAKYLLKYKVEIVPPRR